MAISGADLPVLRELATHLGEKSSFIRDDFKQVLGNLVSGSDAFWTGDYADDFRERFVGFVESLTTIADALDEAKVIVDGKANEIDASTSLR